MRVAVLPERYGHVFSPCASIRLQPFLDELHRSGEIELRYLLLSEVEKYRPDLVVWHRVSLPSPDEVDELADIVRRIGARTIYDIDDNLLDLDGHGEQASYATKKGAVLRSLALAEEVWCSTPKLAERVRRETASRVEILPNALDSELWRLGSLRQGPRPTSGPLRLLYMGTKTHDVDFQLLHEAICLRESERPGSIELSLVGVRTTPAAGENWLRVVSPPPHTGASYPAFVGWFTTLRGFDLGVAPLLSSPFNDCKSPIKVLDYAAIGLPTLASEVPAYTQSLGTGVHCFHANNDATSWANALAEISIDRSRLPRVAEAAWDLVKPDVFVGAVQRRLDRIRETMLSPWMP